MKNLYRLSSYYVDISTTDLPLKLYKLFNNNNENILEIGFGDGEFLIDIAKKQHNRNFIGLEIKKSRFLKAVRKSSELNINNIKFLHIDAVLAIQQLFESCCFTNIYINFPDPWPKLKHHKHRIFNRNLLLNIYEIIAPYGQLHISSDHKEYVLNIINAFKELKEFKMNAMLKRTSNSANFSRAKTRFEQEFIDKGKDIYYLNYMKI